MKKIEQSAKFQELLNKLGGTSTAAEGNREQNEQPEDLKDCDPPSVRESARDNQQPRRFESRIPKLRATQVGGTPVVIPANRTAENVSQPPRGPSRPMFTRPEPRHSTSRPPESDARKSEDAARSKSDRPNVIDRSQLVERQELFADESDEEYPDPPSAPPSPPRASAFASVASHSRGQEGPSRPCSDSRFLQSQPLASRDPRLRNTNRGSNSTWQQHSRNDFPSSRPDPHPLYARPEASMMESLEASRSLLMQSREPPIRQPAQSTTRPQFQSREAPMSRNFAESDAPYFTRQPYERLADVSRSHEFSRCREDAFLRLPTPAEVQDLVAVEKAELRNSIAKMINCPHFTALEVIYALNSIQDTLVGKMEKFCRKRERTESFLRNTLSERLQETSRLDHGRVDAWLDGVGPGNQNFARVAGNSFHY